MTHKEALAHVDSILNAENTTWQEKKNMLADLISHKNDEQFIDLVVDVKTGCCTGDVKLSKMGLAYLIASLYDNDDWGKAITVAVTAINNRLKEVGNDKGRI